MAVTRTTNLNLAKQDGNELVDPTVYGGNFQTISDTFMGGNAQASAVEVAPRMLANQTVTFTSGDLYLTYFTAYRNFSAGHIEVRIGSTAGSGLTKGRIGLYTVDPSTSALTLVASTTNDTAGWTGTYSGASKALTTGNPYSLVSGTRYAIGIIFVGTTAPTLIGVQASSDWALNANPPRLIGKLASQTDLPSTVTDGSLSTIASAPFATLLA